MQRIQGKSRPILKHVGDPGAAPQDHQVGSTDGLNISANALGIHAMPPLADQDQRRDLPQISRAQPILYSGSQPPEAPEQAALMEERQMPLIRQAPRLRKEARQSVGPAQDKFQPRLRPQRAQPRQGDVDHGDVAHVVEDLRAYIDQDTHGLISSPQPESSDAAGRRSPSPSWAARPARAPAPAPHRTSGRLPHDPGAQRRPPPQRSLGSGPAAAATPDG